MELWKGYKNTLYKCEKDNVYMQVDSISKFISTQTIYDLM